MMNFLSGGNTSGTGDFSSSGHGHNANVSNGTANGNSGGAEAWSATWNSPHQFTPDNYTR